MITKFNAVHIALVSRHPGDGDDDGNDDGEKNKGGEFTFTQADMDKAVASAVTKGETAAAGLKTKNQELLDESAGFKKDAKKWEGMDFEEVSGVMKMFNNSEEAQLIKEGKIDEVLEKRMDKANTEHSTAIKALQESNVILLSERDGFKTKYQNKFIDDEIAEYAIKAGARPEALDDIKKRGRGVFTINEKGELEAIDDEKNFIKTKDGDLMTSERFVESLKASHSFYWPDSKSGDLGGDKKLGDDDQAALGKKLQEAADAGDMDAYNKIRKQMA